MTHEQTAFRLFARQYPHEAYAKWPERFWRLFRRMRPGISRRLMVTMLEATKGERPTKPTCAKSLVYCSAWRNGRCVHGLTQRGNGHCVGRKSARKSTRRRIQP